MDTPRVLKVSFEFRIPPGLRANVHASRVESAVASFSAVIHGMAGTVFPWADKVRVQHSWSYEWWSAAEEITLPATDKNTVEPPATDKNTVEPTDDASSAA
jgi:hypothetical protein